MFETLILAMVALPVLSALYHWAFYRVEQHAMDAFEAGAGRAELVAPARHRKVTKASLERAGYSAEAVDAARRVLVAQRKDSAKATIERRVEHLKVAGAVREMKKAATRERRRATMAARACQEVA